MRSRQTKMSPFRLKYAAETNYPRGLAAKNAKGAKKGNYDEEDDDDCWVVHGGKRMYWI